MPKPWTYRGKDRESQVVAPIVQRFANWLESFDPAGSNLGALPSAAHRRQNPKSVHNAGRAQDWKVSSPEGGWRVAKFVAEYPDGLDCQLILYRGYQWGGRAGRGWRYTGVKGHDTHIHFETRGWA